MGRDRPFGVDGESVYLGAQGLLFFIVINIAESALRQMK
jgi:hypothetical protein